MAISSKKSDDMKRKMILEKRITRLEKLIKESERDLEYEVSDFFYQFLEDLDEDDYWVRVAGGSIKKFLEVIASSDADPIVDTFCDELECQDCREEVERILAECAKDVLDSGDYDNDDDGWDDDDDWDDENDEFESRSRVCFNRKNESSSKLNNHRKLSYRRRLYK